MLRELSDYKIKSFVSDRNKSSMTYEVKRTRAVWDDSLSIPGTDRRGGWRCPPGTRYGGQITDRFGRNCGWGVARRLVNELGDLGQRLENIDDRRRERRGQRAVGRRNVQPGLVERAAGRVARALESDGDATPTPPRGRERRERQGQVRRRPNLRESEQRRMDREIEQPGAPRTDERRPARGRRRGNLRESEQRRMDREIEQPGAERTAPGGGAPRRPRPVAPRARRREATADVGRDKPDVPVPQPDAAKRPAKKKVAKKKAPAKKASARRADTPDVAKPEAKPKLSPAKPAEAEPRRVNAQGIEGLVTPRDVAEDSRIIGGDFDGAAERIDGIDANNEMVGDAEEMERQLRDIVARLDKFPQDAPFAVPDGFGGTKLMKVADFRRNVNAAADAWGRFAKRRNKARNRRNKPQRVDMRDIADNSLQIPGDFDRAAERIDAMKNGWGVEDPIEVANGLDVMVERLNRYPADAVIEVPDADMPEGVKDVRVGDLRENMKQAAAAWRRYKKRQPGAAGNENANNANDLARLREINFDVDNAIDVAAQIMEDALGPQPFLDKAFLRNAEKQNREQNRDYLERVRKIAANNPELAQRLIGEAIQALRQNMDGRDASLRDQFRVVANERDEQTRLEVARRAMLDMVYFNAQKNQLNDMQNLLAEIRKPNRANSKPRNADAPPPLFMKKDEFLEFVRVEGVPTPVVITQELDRFDQVYVRHVRQIENPAGLDVDDIDRYIDRALRQKNRSIGERDAAVKKVEELRLRLLEDKEDAAARRRYWDAVNELAKQNYLVRYYDGVAKAYQKKREQAAKELEELGNESASVILQNENAVNEARNRVASALKKQQGVLAAYLDARYGKDNKPWLDMTPEKLQDIKRRAVAGDAQARVELLAWAKSMYEHQSIMGTNGKKYQIVMDEVQNIRPNGDIRLVGNIYHIDEIGRRTRIGGTEREIHIGADDPSEWYVKNAFLKIEKAGHKKAGIATTYNQHAYMWAYAAGIKKAKVGTAWDGPYVWARAGFRADLGGTQVRNMEEQLKLFRNGNLTGLIKNEAEAMRIAALIREWRLYQRIPRDERPATPPVGHIEFIYALDIPTGRGKITRQNEMKEWFIRNMGLNQGVFNFEANGITKDPRD